MRNYYKAGQGSSKFWGCSPSGIDNSLVITGSCCNKQLIFNPQRPTETALQSSQASRFGTASVKKLSLIAPSCGYDRRFHNRKEMLEEVNPTIAGQFQLWFIPARHQMDATGHREIWKESRSFRIQKGNETGLLCVIGDGFHDVAERHFEAEGYSETLGHGTIRISDGRGVWCFHRPQLPESCLDLVKRFNAEIVRYFGAYEIKTAGGDDIGTLGNLVLNANDYE